MEMPNPGDLCIVPAKATACMVWACDDTEFQPLGTLKPGDFLFVIEEEDPLVIGLNGKDWHRCLTGDFGIIFARVYQHWVEK